MISIRCKCGTIYDAPRAILLQCPNCNEIWEMLPGIVEQTEQSWGKKFDRNVKVGTKVEQNDPR